MIDHTRPALVALLAVALAATPGMALEIVVHPSNDESITRAELSKIFLKRLRTWKNGQPVEPVDQGPGPVREEFSLFVHGRSSVAVEIYWRRMVYSGRAAPPRQAAGDREVVEFVRANPGAVGYVSGAADLEGVRVLEIDP